MSTVQFLPKNANYIRTAQDSSTSMYFEESSDRRDVYQHAKVSRANTFFDMTAGLRVAGRHGCSTTRRHESPTRCYLVMLKIGSNQPKSSVSWTREQGWQALVDDEISLPIPIEDVMDRQVNDILIPLYGLDTAGDQQAATDLLFDRVDKLLVAGEFRVCNELLKKVHIERLSTSLMRSFLAITFPAKDQLESRPDLFSRIEKRMITLRGLDVTKRLLDRLI